MVDGIPDLDEVLAEALRRLGRINILVAGKTGVGKSTLINAVFQGELATTGVGRPVTLHTRYITKEGVPLGIYDTRGLEAASFRETIGELEKLIQDRRAQQNADDHIHVGWVCLVEDSRRVEPAESELVHMLTRREVPVIAVITKAKSDEGFRDAVTDLLSDVKNVVRVRALATVFDDGHRLESMGLDDLIELTDQVVPEGQRNALSAAQRVSLKQKQRRSHAAVATAVTAAASVGLTPIPFADAAAIVPIQVTMLASVSAIWGLPVNRAFLGTLVGGAMAGTGGTAAGRATVTGLLKLIPGAGQVVGGMVSAATAGVLTTAFGEAYIATLSVVARDPQRVPTPDEVREEFMAQLRRRKRLTGQRQDQ